MVNKHTPGPWVFRHEGEELPAVLMPRDDGFGYVAQCNRAEDARLMGAAPELLATLNAIVERWDSFDDPSQGPEPLDTLIEAARVAITKAKGV